DQRRAGDTGAAPGPGRGDPRGGADQPAGAGPGTEAAGCGPRRTGGGVLMAVTLTYDATLARVRLSATAVTGPTVAVERSTDQIRWTTVRGGAALAVTGGTVSLDDYEFVPGVPNH